MIYFEQFPEAPLAAAKQRSVKRPASTRLLHPEEQHRSWTELGSATYLVESTFGDYSYTAGNVQIIYATIGKYCSIANSVRINPGNHPQWRVTQHHMTYRRAQFGLAVEDDHDFFQWRREHACTIGHDVWIGHGAVIMPGVNVGTERLIGSERRAS